MKDLSSSQETLPSRMVVGVTMQWTWFCISPCVFQQESQGWGIIYVIIMFKDSPAKRVGHPRVSFSKVRCKVKYSRKILSTLFRARHHKSLNLDWFFNGSKINLLRREVLLSQLVHSHRKENYHKYLGILLSVNLLAWCSVEFWPHLQIPDHSVPSSLRTINELGFLRLQEMSGFVQIS